MRHLEVHPRAFCDVAARRKRLPGAATHRATILLQPCPGTCAGQVEVHRACAGLHDLERSRYRRIGPDQRVAWSPRPPTQPRQPCRMLERRPSSQSSANGGSRRDHVEAGARHLRGHGEGIALDHLALLGVEPVLIVASTGAPCGLASTSVTAAAPRMPPRSQVRRSR